MPAEGAAGAMTNRHVARLVTSRDAWLSLTLAHAPNREVEE
jgi:hypothetical protein